MSRLIRNGIDPYFVGSSNKTLPDCNAGAIANAVIEDELQTTSAPPSGSIRKQRARSGDIRANCASSDPALMGAPLHQ